MGNGLSCIDRFDRLRSLTNTRRCPTTCQTTTGTLLSPCCNLQEGSRSHTSANGRRRTAAPTSKPSSTRLRPRTSLWTVSAGTSLWPFTSSRSRISISWTTPARRAPKFSFTAATSSHLGACRWILRPTRRIVGRAVSFAKGDYAQRKLTGQRDLSSEKRLRLYHTEDSGSHLVTCDYMATQTWLPSNGRGCPFSRSSRRRLSSSILPVSQALCPAAVSS